MDFGKCSSLEGINFSLPPDHPATAGRLGGLAYREGPPALYFGCTGWSMKEWVGTWYPWGAKPEHFLGHYGRQFNTIELNTTHYRIPTPAQVAQWRDAVPAAFRFCPKVPQRISHSADLGFSSGQIPLFVESMTHFGEKLGPSFLQLPPTFGPSRAETLDRFMRGFPCGTIPLAVEFRHPDWFSTPEGWAVFDRMAALGVSVVITDVAGRRDVLHQCLTTGSVLLRFVGNELHPTDFERLDAWTERLQTWFALGLREAFVFLHEPDNRMAPELAAHWVPLASKALGISMQAPQRLGLF